MNKTVVKIRRYWNGLEGYIRVGFFAVTWLTIMKVSFIIELGYVLLLLFLAEICIDYKSKLSRNIGIGVIIIVAILFTIFVARPFR